MFDEKRQINNTNEWYQKMQLCRRIPPRRVPVDGYDKPECYALSLQNARLPGLKMDVLYRIHAYFYDKERKYFFGKPFYGGWCRPGSDSVPFREVVTISTYSVMCAGVLPLHPGSPKALLFMSSQMEMSDLPRKTNVDVEICLRTEREMYSVVDYIPDWYIFSRWEDIPGLRTSYHGKSQAIYPEALKSRTSILRKINVSFGMDVCKFEQILLHLMNNDRLYRANRSPADINNKMMEVLERRITIGMHNGLCYVEKPQCLHLSSSENQICSTSGMKRSQSLLMKGSVILSRMIADPHFAVIFSLDYLVGVYSCDRTIHSSQTVMVCWGAWCPFAVDVIPNGEITVPLVGGPSINPDERLAFRIPSVLLSDLPFSDQFPTVEITFKCSGFGEAEHLLDTSAHVYIEQDWKKPNVETVALQLSSTKIAQNLEKRFENRHEIKSSLPISSEEGKSGEVSSNGELKCDSYTSVRIFGSPLMRTSSISRASLAILSGVSFAPIKDRNGNKPKLLDIENFAAPEINVELNDKLSTNEIIVQFMAVQIRVNVDCAKTPNAVFFTMEFYRFHTVTTEKLWLNMVHAKTTDREQLFILKRKGNVEETAKEDCNGFTVRYMVDGNSLANGEEDDYINYLLNGCAIADVWDADSLLHLGKLYIPLKFMLRHGSEAVQANIQSAVMLSNLPESSITTYQVLLRLTSIGYPCFKQIDSTQNRTNAVISRRLIRIGENENESYRIRAKPLNPIHENSLQYFLASQKLDINQRYNEIMDGSPLGARNHNSLTKPLTTKGSMKRYLFEQELEAYKKLRDEDKASKLLKVVFKAITTEYRIYPKYGQVIFFEYMLQNTEPNPVVIVVDTAQSTVKPLFDVELWQYYKDMYEIETPLERDLYRISTKEEQITEVQIFLKPMETICAPFIYDGFALPAEQIRNQVKIIFKKKNGGEPIAILDLLVGNRRNIVFNSFRFYHEAETTLSRIIQITGYKSRVSSIRCTDPLVLISFRNNIDGSQDLHFTCQTGKPPMLRTFTVIFFADRYCSTVLGAWLIHIHAVTPIILNAVQAQLIKVPIFLKTDGNSDGSVRFGSFSKNLEIHPSDATVAQCGYTLDAVVNFLPDFTGSRVMLISAINQQTNRLLYQWMITVNVKEANITKMFEVYLQNKRNQTIRLAVRNRYSVERSFRISCSHPENIRIENDTVMLSGHKAIDVPITFLLNSEVKLSEVFLFITNVENDLQEEVYSLKLIYHD
ncbi:unnamed protein product [Litomosoides sigmodontis]|uniref:Nephrocystin-4 n=1 Tax=Litomosoides sigmodontis TaxID=42156 RepID=A0A3P6SXP1_LITSI|nr:unnamed protein product [Litomosoides sigmodontis]